MESFDSDESIVQAPVAVAAEESKRDTWTLIDNDEDDDAEDWWPAESTVGLITSHVDTSTAKHFNIQWQNYL